VGTARYGVCGGRDDVSAIDLTVRVTQVGGVSVYHGERLLGRSQGLTAEGRDDIEARCRRANAALALVRIVRGLTRECGRAFSWEDHIENTPEKRKAAYSRGFIDGLAGKTQPYPNGGGLIPDLPPESGISYGRGYDAGDAVRRAAEIADAEIRSESPTP
jgi:hypothetical protein